MGADQQDLLRRTRVLVETDRYSDAPLEFRGLAAPAELQLFSEWERTLGASFPSLMKEIYGTLSNGGIGPGYGLIGIGDGIRDDQGRDLVETHEWFVEWGKDMEDCLWPEQLIPFLHWGCGIYACVDLRTEHGAIVDFDPNDWEETPETWNDCFQSQSNSFASWWAKWLNEKEVEAGEASVDSAHQ